MYSRSDELVLPFTTAPQDVCPGRVVTHGGLLSDALTHRLVIDALTHTGPAAPDRLPFLGRVRVSGPLAWLWGAVTT
ncbi:hypothetical protein QEZ40_004687 [Streptomyces katrae]|uniref:Uncharacterized protein n=1 Tax=Streptomyces katrae TaxID=68223 RepID=A0ABT7H052_9ACTN|nr:hypothetical protein [Streptomyces katrae]MDK9499270.1 hypothetical protein [Streptomyces katrae]